MDTADDPERQAKAARAKALLKKRTKKKGAVPITGSPLSGVVTPTPSAPSSVFSPPASEAGDRNEFDAESFFNGDNPHPSSSVSAKDQLPEFGDRFAVNTLPPSEDSSALLVTQQQTISLLVSEKASLTASLERLEDVEQKSQDYQATLEENQNLIETLKSTIATLEEQLQQIRTAHADVSSSEREQSEKARELERDLESARRQASDLQSRVQACLTQIRELEEAVQANEQVEALEKSLKGTQDRAESLEFQLSKSKQAHAKLQSVLVSTEAELRDLKALEEEWQQKHTSLLQDHSTSETSLATITSERDSLYTRHSELESRAIDDQSTLNTLRQQIEALAAELATGNRQLQNAQSDVAHANRRADDAEHAQKDLQTENVDLMASLNEMRPKIVELTQDKVALGEHVEELQKTIRNLNATIAELESTIAESQTRSDEKSSTAAARENQLISEKAVLEENLRGLDEAYSNMEAEISSLRGSVQELEAERAAHRKAVVQHQDEVERLQAELAQHPTALAVLTAELSDSQRAATEFQETLTRAQTEVEILRGEVSAKEEEVAKLTDQLAIASSSPRDPSEPDTPIDSEILSAVQQQHALELSAARSQIRTLETSVYQEEAKAHSLQRQVAALEDEMAQLKAAAQVTRSSTPQPLHPLQRVSSGSMTRRSSDRSRAVYSPPPLKHSTSYLAPIRPAAFDESLPPETRHKRKISLSMLKARIDSEREAAAALALSPAMGRAILSSGRGLSPTVEEPLNDSSGDVLHVHSKRPQFGDEAHVFWCHACTGDLVVL